MSALVLFCLFCAIVFAVWFVLRRKFALPVLALAALVTIANTVYGSIAILFAGKISNVSNMMLGGIIWMILVFTGVIVTSLRSQKVYGVMQRIIHSALGTIACCLLSYAMLWRVIPRDGSIAVVDGYIEQYAMIVMAGIFGAALLSVWTHRERDVAHHGKHKKER